MGGGPAVIGVLYLAIGIDVGHNPSPTSGEATGDVVKCSLEMCQNADRLGSAGPQDCPDRPWRAKAMMLTGNRRWVAAAIVMIAGSDTRAADLELGRYLATECMVCHRSGDAASAIPDIFGKAEQDLTELIVAYRERRLPNPVMQNVASRLTDEEIASLALYFATAKKP